MVLPDLPSASDGAAVSLPQAIDPGRTGCRSIFDPEEDWGIKRSEEACPGKIFKQTRLALKHHRDGSGKKPGKLDNRYLYQNASAFVHQSPLWQKICGWSKV